MPDTWAEGGHFFDLADFLTWHATGSAARSQCTLTCKWTYLAHEKPGWQHDFFEMMGIADMLERGGLPDRASPVAADLGPLTASAARDLGLDGECRVGAGLIDAHAGALGVLGGLAEGPGSIERHMALIAGTSSCVMALSRRELASPGIWGPYYGAALPESWLVEGGQSATGALLDHILRWHGAGGEPTSALHRARRRPDRGAEAGRRQRSRRASACAARFSRQPFAARRPPRRRRDQRTDARRFLRQPLPALLAQRPSPSRSACATFSTG